MRSHMKITLLIVATTLIFQLVRSTKEGIDCKFTDKSLCGWKQDQNDNFDWLFNCKYQDCLVYIESTSHRADEKSRLLSPTIDPPNKNRCFSFNYHMFGERVNALNVYLEKSEQSQLIWHRKHSQDNVWRKGYRTITSQSDQTTIVIEAVTAHRVNSTTTDGIIAIKNITLSDGTCAPPKEYQTDENCDFEEDFCMWKSDEHKWEKTKSSDIDLSDKPATDHTTRTDNGYFAYISSDKNNPSVSDSLISSVFPGTNTPRCLLFSYYMQRGTQARIEVYITYVDKEFLLLSTQIGVEENEWTTTDVPILNQNKNHSIQVSGVITDDPNGFVAIDDMIIVDRMCESVDSCGFEFGWCGWRNLITETSKEIAWLRSNAGEWVVDVPDMPKMDFTGTDAGFFLMVDMSNAKPNQTATLSSKPLQTCPICFTFEYFTSTENHDGKLEIFVKNWSGERIQATISDATNSWRKKSVHITWDCSSKPYEIYIRATAGSATEFIAIDELSITDGICKPDEIPTTVPTTQPTSTTRHSTHTTTTSLPPTLTTASLPYTPILEQKNCPNGTVDCGNGNCVFAIFLCDGIKDCANNADEANCTLDCQDKKASIFCQGFNSPQCMPTNHLCDGRADCINEADETDLLCGSCPKEYCVTGRCLPFANSAPHCACNDFEHEGRRCEAFKIKDPQPLPATPTSEKDYIMWIMVPMMSLLVVIIAILLVNLYCYRKYKWYHAAGLLGQKNRSLYYQRNSMTEMTTTNTEVEEVSDDVGLAEAPVRRGVRDDAISMIHAPLTNYKLHSLYIGRVVLDDDGNIVAVSNA